MAAQKRKHDKPKPKPKLPNTDHEGANASTPDPSKQPPQIKGNLNIRTVALPKRCKLRSFKCPSCKHISRSEKERNNHHKSTHGMLNCAVCNATFDTPSGLHHHKYKHSDQKFICETCGEKFAFSSKLKEHRIKHLTGRGFKCFSKNCDKTFKNNSSLVCHLKVHEGKTFCCPEAGCEYSTNVERNLKLHMTIHSDTHNYSCGKCGQAFKYYTQLSSHVDNKACST